MARKRNRPLYPVLAAAALALGSAAVSGCGLPEEAAIARSQQQILPADAGTQAPQQPGPGEFVGGDVAWVPLPDGGTVP